MRPVCMMRPSDSANVRAPGAARRLNTDSRATYSMSMKSGSLKPHKFTNVTMSVSDTVLPRVRKVAPTSCCSKVKPWLRMAGSFRLAARMRRRPDPKIARLLSAGRLLEDHEPHVGLRRVADRRVVPPVNGLPRRDDIDDAHALEAALVGLEPAEDRLIRALSGGPGPGRADEDQ